MRRLARRSPGVEVELRPAGWTAATALLVAGSVSAALMTRPFPAGLATAARFQVPITHLAVAAGDPLAAVTPLRLEQLSGRDVLLPRSRPPGSVWAQLAAQLGGGFSARVAPDTLDDLPGALDLVAAGLGRLPVPRLLVATVSRPDVAFLPLDAGGLRMTYALVWRQNGATAETVTLVQTVQEVLRDSSPSALSRRS